ncbi:MAG TPA: hypothetical protein VGC19_01430 [Rhodanobacter sp.]
MIDTLFRRLTGYRLLVLALLVVAAIYWAGLDGSWLFDDYPNIVDNHGVQSADAGFSSLVRAALSSPASDFKRPLASLSFAANYLASGLDPYAMKLTNLVIHLLNGLLVFVLARGLLRSADVGAHPVREDSCLHIAEKLSRTGCTPTGQRRRAPIVAALIAAGWMLLPINLTGVLYVVQRMESMANLFVLLGLIGYMAGRQRMLAPAYDDDTAPSPAGREGLGWGRSSLNTRGFMLCLASIILCTGIGSLAKETAVMLPLYALLIEWALFRFRKQQVAVAMEQAASPRTDFRIVALFTLMLALPMILGMAWLVPSLLKPESWATRDFTLGTRLLSEARIVVDYITWTLLPTPGALSFYHDDFHISIGLLAPWSTLASIVILAALIVLAIRLRPRFPLVSLGMALFLACHLLTGTVLPLELIYEHRNYFASFGLMLAVVPLLCASRSRPFAPLRYLLLTGLLIYWASFTAFTAYAWGSPMRLAEELASRAPESPRAQYELGRTYIIYSHYDPASPFTSLAYAPLEKSASLPESSILPEQALIFMNSRMHLPLKDSWWDSMISKLGRYKPGVQDESSLSALTTCAHENDCDLPKGRMMETFSAALRHSTPSARLEATYADYAWNVAGDHSLGLRMIQKAVKSNPYEPAYRITLIRMLAAQGNRTEATQALKQLSTLNFGGRLDESLDQLSTLPGMR